MRACDFNRAGKKEKQGSLDPLGWMDKNNQLTECRIWNQSSLSSRSWIQGADATDERDKVWGGEQGQEMFWLLPLLALLSPLVQLQWKMLTKDQDNMPFQQPDTCFTKQYRQRMKNPSKDKRLRGIYLFYLLIS